MEPKNILPATSSFSVTSGAPLLSYRADPTYAPSGETTGHGLLLAACGGLLTAAFGAAAGLVWMLLHLPTWYILPSIAQGLLVGGVLLRLLRRGKVRSPAAAIAIGIVCGLTSALFFTGLLYWREVYMLRDQLRHLVQTPGKAKGLTGLAAVAENHPFQVFDLVILGGQTVHRGLLGYFIVKGAKLWMLDLLQAGIVTYFAVKLGKTATQRPFCETCGGWFKELFNVAVLPISFGPALAAAVASDDIQQVMVIHNQAAGKELGSSCAIARVHRCPGCGHRFAEVVVKGHRIKDTILLRPHRISPEMVEALKYEPADPDATLPQVEDAATNSSNSNSTTADESQVQNADPTSN